MSTIEKNTNNPSHLIWIDLEMTGLNVNEDYIIEIATIVTDSQLNILAEGPNCAIFQEEMILNKMDAWNQKHHGQSGLIDRIKTSTISATQAQDQTIAFLKQYVNKNESPMCGNTICQDRRFLARHMPQLEAYFHYRHIDVSTVKELAKRWAPNLYQTHKKESAHKALDDIKESISELQYYKSVFFKLGES